MRTITILMTLVLSVGVVGAQDTSSQEQTLWNSYRHNSVGELDRFFQVWAREIPPITDAELQTLNDTLQHAYRIFKTFYQPRNIKKIGGSEFGNDVYKHSSWFIVQAKLYIGFVKTLNRDSIVHAGVKQLYPTDTARQHELLKKVNGKYQPNTLRVFNKREKPRIVDSIENFRPPIKNAVFLTDTYERLLTDFLGNEHSPFGNGDIMNPAKAKGESKKRLDFINQRVTIFQGHWGGYWVLVSQPYAFNIAFDPQLKFAIINYKLIYEGGEVLLERQSNNNWKIIEAKRTWIE